MKQEFRLTQLYRSSADEYIKGTCRIHSVEDDDRFECSIQGDINFKNQLWHWVAGNWNGVQGIKCLVEFTDVNDGGLPTDGVITKIYGFTHVEI